MMTMTIMMTVMMMVSVTPLSVSAVTEYRDADTDDDGCDSDDFYK